MIGSKLLVKMLVPLSVLAVLAVSSGPAAWAQSTASNDNGRYTMSQIGNTLVRLDTRTGVVSTCNDNGNGLACYTVPDERAALDIEIGRLRDDNERLRADLAQRDSVAGKMDEPLPKEALPKEALPKEDPLVPRAPKAADGSRKLEIPLPSDRDMDRVMSFLESAWKRLVDLAARMQKDASKI